MYILAHSRAGHTLTSTKIQTKSSNRLVCSMVGPFQARQGQLTVLQQQVEAAAAAAAASGSQQILHAGSSKPGSAAGRPVGLAVPLQRTL